MPRCTAPTVRCSRRTPKPRRTASACRSVCPRPARRSTVATRMLRNGELTGIVYVEAEYPLMAQVKRYLSVLGAVLLGSLLVAMLMASWMQTAIIRPVLALTAAVDQMIRRRDFSMRVTKTTGDEVGVLVDAFNGMLTEVGERAKTVEESNARMQHEVRVRVD